MSPWIQFDPYLNRAAGATVSGVYGQLGEMEIDTLRESHARIVFVAPGARRQAVARVPDCRTGLDRQASPSGLTARHLCVAQNLATR
jgi:hypothetical protein